MTQQNNRENHNDIDKDSSTWRTFLKLWPLIAEHKFILFLAVIFLIASAFADTSLIALLRPLLDRGFSMNDQDFLLMAPFYKIGRAHV